MGSVALAPDAVRPAQPLAERPAALPTPLAKDLVTRLARAVQRATIYPPGHPSVRLAASPFVEALRAVPVAEVLVGFTSDRVFVGTHHRDAEPFELPWMSARLSARGLSSLRLSPRIALEEAERLIVWLAGSDDLLAGAELPTFDGATVARVDFAAVRFRDVPPEDAAAGTPAELAWQAASQLLAGDWAAGSPGTLTADPEELARLVRDAIEQREGTGVAEIGERLVAVGAQLEGLPEDVQAAVKARLATFVTALSPELRGQLLTASAGDDPAKLALLGGIVDRLPSAMVLEVIQGAELVRGSSSRQFVSFMLKLASLAATEPQLAEAFECRCSAAGLPRDLAYLETPQLRAVLEDLLESRPDDSIGIAPEEYQRRLEAISASPTDSRRAYDSDRHASATDPAVLARQNARIALLLLGGGGLEPPDQATCLDRLLEALPHGLEAWDIELLAGTAEIARRFSSGSDVVEHVATKASQAAAWFEQPAALAAVLARIEGSDEDPVPDLLVVARAGGVALAETMLVRVARSAPAAGRTRVTRAIAWLEPDTVRLAIAEVHRKAPRHARALLTALADGGVASPVAEVAQLLLADEDPAVRLDAFRALYAVHAGTPRWDVLVRRGLEDCDPRVLRLAIDEAGSRQRAGLRPLCAFLDRRVPAALAVPQLHAVRTVAAMESREARDGLRVTLSARGLRLDAASRGVSAAIASVLATGGDGEDERAARAWRRSPAGWLTWLVGGGRSA